MMEEASQSEAKVTEFGFSIDENSQQELIDNSWSSDPPRNLDRDDEQAVRQHTEEIPQSDNDEPGLSPSSIRPSQPPAGETFDSVLKRYEEVNEKFLESKTWVRLQRIVQRHLHLPVQIDNAICIALGSLSAMGQSTGTLDDRTTSLFQLAAFIAVVGELQTKMSEIHEKWVHLQEQGVVEPRNMPQVKISITAQEPRFNDLDKQLLKHLGIQVVEDPEIWSRIDELSMVYMPGAEGSHFLEVSRRCSAMWWPVGLEYFEYLKKLFLTSFFEYDLTHSYLEFPDLTYPSIDSTSNEELPVFGEDSAVYLLRSQVLKGLRQCYHRWLRTTTPQDLEVITEE